jgi:hypothetical protein
LDPRLEQRASQIAVAIRAPFRGALCRVGHGFMWTPSILAVIALWTAYTKPFTQLEEE